MTKQFTAALILKLQELGSLSVEDGVVQHLPDFPYPGITIHHLLTHTSGLANYTQVPKMRPRPREDLSHAQVRALSEELPLRFEPDTNHEYCNSGYYLLGLIAAEASGRPYPDALQEHLCQPLGLDSTSYDSTSRVIPNRASGYEWDGQRHRNAQYLSMRLPGGGGGICTSVEDLLSWQRALHGGEFLAAESVASMHRPTVLASGEEIPYGYGMGTFEFEGERKFRHGGGINGFACILSVYPEHGLAVAVLTNIGTDQDTALESEVARLVLDLPAPPTPPVVAMSDQRLSAIAGTYTDGYGHFPATVEDGGISCLG